jgi:hypothetical protein
VLFVDGVASDHISAHHAGEVVGRLAKFIGQPIGLKAQFVGAVDLFFREHINREQDDKNDTYAQCQPKAAGKPGQAVLN